MDPNMKPPYRPPYRLSPEKWKRHGPKSMTFLQKVTSFHLLHLMVPQFYLLKNHALTNYACALTVKNRYPLPRIDDLLDHLHGATIFSSLDLHSGYHQIRLSPEDQHRCAFTSPFGRCEMHVLAFGLANAPATFQTLMNNIFKDKINKYTLVYLDDLLVFSKTP
ncbi:hypothetical protein Vretimale_13824 [Volvox reticuliferus]|uniref:Reverse transcriptase domain-containing protein n=1 Tax=Volvox reticuliferus TaxID=1737510 RepID=A0A8J4GKZ6_9CHLO|nr:hypothetical protein Vretimale_13824 [Volvox reticuliferus]